MKLLKTVPVQAAIHAETSLLLHEWPIPSSVN